MYRRDPRIRPPCCTPPPPPVQHLRTQIKRGNGDSSTVETGSNGGEAPGEGEEDDACTGMDGDASGADCSLML
jgi:hypothetical protein